MRPNDIDIDKKKSHFWRNCLIISLVLLVVLVGGAFGGAYFAYNSFAEPILGISMFDAFGVINNVGKYKKEEILTNSYSDADAEAFYAGLENATCLELPEDFTVSGAVNAVLASSAQGTDPNQPTPPPAPSPAPMAGEGGIGSTLNDFNTGNAYLDDVLKRTRFDMSSLAGYENGGKDLSVTDKQFAAIINEVYKGLDMKEIKDIETQLGVSLQSLLTIEQVTIDNDVTLEKMLTNNETILAEPAGDGSITVDPLRKNVRISVVLCAHLGPNVEKVLMKQVPSLPGFVGSLATMLLPDKIYVGLGVYPYDETRQPDLFINNVKGKVMNDLLKAVDGVLKQSNPEGGVAPMFGKVTSMITSTVSTIENMVGKLNFVDSALEMDPISAVMTVLKVNDPNAPVDPVTGEKPAYITGDNFFTMLKHIYNADNRIDGMSAADIEAKREQYLAQVIASADRVTKDDYTTNIDRLSQAYGVEKVVSTDPNIAFDMSAWTPNDFVTKYQEIPAHVNIVDKRADGKYLYDIPQSELLADTLVTDNALGYMVNEIIGEKVASGELKLPVTVAVESFALYEPKGLPGELRARFTGSVETSALLADMSKDAVLYNIMQSVLPQFMFLEIDLPMSTNAGKGNLILNFVGQNDKVALSEGMSDEEREAGIKLTEDAFDTLYRIVKALSPDMGEQIKLNNLLNTLQQLVDEMLAQLNGTLGGGAAMAGEGELKLPPIALVPGGVQMPTIYDIVRTATGNLTLDSEDLRLALKDLYTYKVEDAQPEDVLDGFIADELEGKLFLVNEVVNTATGEKKINASNLFDKLSNIGNDVTTNGVGSVINARGLIEDTRENVDDLKLAVTDKELAGIINSSTQLVSVGGSMPYVNLKATTSTKITEEGGAFYMSLTVRGDFDETSLGEGPMGIKFRNLLPREIYLTAKVRLTGADGERYKTEVFINDNDNNTTPEEKAKIKATIDTVLKSFMPADSGGQSMSIATIEQLIGDNIAKALASLESTGASLTFKTGSIVAMSIYDVIYDNVVSKGLTEEDKAKLSKNPAQDVMKIFKAILANVTIDPIADADFTRLIGEEFNGKLLLADGTISADSADIFGDLSGLTANGADIFDKLAPNKVLDYASAEEMRIMILESELRGIMKQQMASFKITDSLPQIFALPSTGSPLAGFNINGHNEIEIVLGLSVNKGVTDPTYDNILPFMPNNILVHATMAITEKVAADGTHTLEGATTITLNGQAALVQNDSVYYERSKVIMKGLSSGFDMSQIETEISSQVIPMLSKMVDTGMSVEFVKGVTAETTGLKSSSIYDIMRHADKSTFKDVTNDELHNVMRGLQDTTAGARLNPFVDKGESPDGKFNVEATLTEATVTIPDYYIAYKMFEKGINNQDDGSTIGETKEIAILSGTGLQKARSVYGADAIKHNRGIVLGVKVTDPTSFNGTGKTGISKILPAGLYLTIIFDIPDATGTNVNPNDVGISLFINGMTSAEMTTLDKMMGAGDNATTKIGEAVKTSIFAAELNIGVTGIPAIKLGDILCGKDTIYVDKYVSTQPSEIDDDAIFGALQYTVPITIKP